MTFWQRVKFIASSIGKALWPFIAQFLNRSGQIILESAMVAVKQVAADPTLLTGGERQSAAFRIIKEDAIAKGIQAGTSIIFSAIEVQYNRLKPELKQIAADAQKSGN